MNTQSQFSEPIEIPNIPEGPSLAIILNEKGEVLQITAGINIRRRIGQLLDNGGVTAVHGPKIYNAQLEGERIFVRWKLTPNFRDEKRNLMDDLDPLWAPR